MRDATEYKAMPNAPRLPPHRGAELAPLMFWQSPVPPGLDAGTFPGPPIAVYLNHGRWVAECPDCNGAQLASYTDHRFLCNECANITVAGMWRATIWPPNRVEIETALTSRRPANQNWHPGETADDLKRENLTRGPK